MKPLYHISENSKIKIFEPRPPPSPDSGVVGDAVWAIDDDRLPHYLLPRDCPRVAMRACPQTTALDRKIFFGNGAERGIAIELAWYDRALKARLFAYELPPETFALVDKIAGYYISRKTVVPRAVYEVKSPLEEIVARGYKLRLLPSLLALKAAVIKSSVQYSIIRFRNTCPPA